MKKTTTMRMVYLAVQVAAAAATSVQVICTIDDKDDQTTRNFSDQKDYLLHEECRLFLQVIIVLIVVTVTIPKNGIYYKPFWVRMMKITMTAATIIIMVTIMIMDPNIDQKHHRHIVMLLPESIMEVKMTKTMTTTTATYLLHHRHRGDIGNYGNQKTVLTTLIEFEITNR